MSPKEKRRYNQWSEENMKEAIRKYKTGRYGLNEICRLYEISKPTFKRHLNSTNVKFLKTKIFYFCNFNVYFLN